jgi:trimeric autotransporter adhesin
MSTRRNLAAAVVAAAVIVPLFALACDDGAATSPSQHARSVGGPGDPAGFAVVTEDTAHWAREIALPYTDTVTSGVPMFEMKQKGGGHAIRAEITNSGSSGIALDGVSSGGGHALLAWNLGLGRAAVLTQTNSSNTLPAVDVSTSGQSNAMKVSINNTANVNSSLLVDSRGTGAVLTVNHLGSAGALAQFQVAGVNKVRFSRNGKGFFNGGTQTGGADVAEEFEVESGNHEYTPGDVMVISEFSDRRVERSTQAYSTLVIGVYATKPGVLLTERETDDSLVGRVPVGVIGVIPTKVSGENGAIRRGDLLVSAAIPGHAMRGTDRDRMFGAVIGKALAPFSQQGTGVIPVLVNIR